MVLSKSQNSKVPQFTSDPCPVQSKKKTYIYGEADLRRGGGWTGLWTSCWCFWILGGVRRTLCLVRLLRWLNAAHLVIIIGSETESLLSITNKIIFFLLNDHFSHRSCHHSEVFRWTFKAFETYHCPISMSMSNICDLPIKSTCIQIQQEPIWNPKNWFLFTEVLSPGAKFRYVGSGRNRETVVLVWTQRLCPAQMKNCCTDN